MNLSRSRWVIGVMTLIVSVGAGLVVSLGGGSQPAARAASSSGIWIQTMDSCKNSIGGATYQLVGTSITASTPASGPKPVVIGAPQPACPLEHGDCATKTSGCTSFTGLAPGAYTLQEVTTPPANTTNPQGYAPCEGGSACRSQTAVLTVGSGSAQATVTAVYPDGFTTTNTFAGTASDPIVFHDFGLGAGSCDGDNDADDHLTGTPSSHCAYPEGQESSACTPFPWSCAMQSNPGVTESPNEHFIHAAYRAMVGHDVDAGGLSYWLGQLDGGAPRSALAMALATSPEYRTNVIGGNVASGVKDFYDLYLHRTADPAGIAYWVGRMAGVGGPAVTFEQVRLQFVGSPEFFNVTNGGNPTTIITALYSDLLNRAPDQAGMNYWTTHFNVNTIASQFLFSPEGRQVLVESYYSSILHRAADAPGLAYWTQQLLSGASDENIIASIMSGTEFLANAQSVS